VLDVNDSAGSSESGFSHNTCRPADSASRTCAACSGVGVANKHASIPGSSNASAGSASMRPATLDSRAASGNSRSVMVEEALAIDVALPAPAEIFRRDQRVRVEGDRT
jgi:hypothetical protein